MTQDFGKPEGTYLNLGIYYLCCNNPWKTVCQISYIAAKYCFQVILQYILFQNELGFVFGGRFLSQFQTLINSKLIWSKHSVVREYAEFHLWQGGVLSVTCSC